MPARRQSAANGAPFVVVSPSIRAPNIGQEWRFILVDDPEIKSRVAPLYRQGNKLNVYARQRIDRPLKAAPGGGAPEVVAVTSGCCEAVAAQGRPSLLTFDDGERSVFERGLPVVREFELEPILFVWGGLIDTDEPCNSGSDCVTYRVSSCGGTAATTCGTVDALWELGRKAEPQLLDPAVLARISDLELVARTVVEGFLSGLHRSAHLGVSMDFAEHRPYMPGDDSRRIDWRVYARTDRYLIREYEAETNTNVMVALDVGSTPLGGHLAGGGPGMGP